MLCPRYRFCHSALPHAGATTECAAITRRALGAWRGKTREMWSKYRDSPNAEFDRREPPWAVVALSHGSRHEEGPVSKSVEDRATSEAWDAPWQGANTLALEWFMRRCDRFKHEALGVPLRPLEHVFVSPPWTTRWPRQAILGVSHGSQAT
jgi:hypothetical protein